MTHFSFHAGFHFKHLSYAFREFLRDFNPLVAYQLQPEALGIYAVRGNAAPPSAASRDVSVTQLHMSRFYVKKKKNLKKTQLAQHV